MLLSAGRTKAVEAQGATTPSHKADYSCLQVSEVLLSREQTKLETSSTVEAQEVWEFLGRRENDSKSNQLPLSDCMPLCKPNFT